MSHRKTNRGKKVAWKLEDKNGKKIATIFPVKIVSEKGGRPPAKNRRVFEAVIWFCRAGCPWEELPKKTYFHKHCPRGAPVVDA